MQETVNLCEREGEPANGPYSDSGGGTAAGSAMASQPPRGGPGGVARPTPGNIAKGETLHFPEGVFRAECVPL